MVKVLLSLALMLFAASSVFAGIEEAHSAYDKGNYEQAFSLYRTYAEQGDADAQYDLALMFYDGTGVPQDLPQAARWLTEAAEQGLVDAQLFLGGLFFEGKGVRQDYDMAVKWYRRAAQTGNVDAEYNMGYMYEYGYGVPIDCDRAEAWYSRAASQGDDEAQEILQSFSCRDYINIAFLNTATALVPFQYTHPPLPSR